MHQIEHRIQPAARHQLPVPIQDGAQIRGPSRGQPPVDLLGDRGEGDVLLDIEQWHSVFLTSGDQIRGRFAVEGATGDQRGHFGPRDIADELLTVLGFCVPLQPGQHEVAAGQVPAGIEHVGGYDPAYEAVQLVLSGDEP